MTLRQKVSALLLATALAALLALVLWPHLPAGDVLPCGE